MVQKTIIVIIAIVGILVIMVIVVVTVIIAIRVFLWLIEHDGLATCRFYGVRESNFLEKEFFSTTPACC